MYWLDIEKDIIYKYRLFLNIAPFIPQTRTKPRSIDMREVVNAILYVLKTGIKRYINDGQFVKHQLRVPFYVFPKGDAILEEKLQKAKEIQQQIKAKAQ